MNGNKLHVQQLDWLRSLGNQQSDKGQSNIWGSREAAFYRRVSVQMASWFHQSNIRATRRDGKAE